LTYLTHIKIIKAYPSKKRTKQQERQQERQRHTTKKHTHYIMSYNDSYVPFNNTIVDEFENGGGYGTEDGVQPTAADGIYADAFDTLLFVLGVIIFIRFFQGLRENMEDYRNNNLSEEEKTEQRLTRMDQISTRLDFTTIQEENPSSVEIASGSVDLDADPTKKPTKTKNTEDSDLPNNETKEKDPISEPEGHNQDDLEDPKISSNDNTSNHFVSAVSSFFTSMRSTGGGQQQEEECCSVCLEPYKGGDIVATLKPSFGGTSCKHKFHKDCLLEWLQDHEDCPLCRINMTGVILENLSDRLFYP